MDGYRRNGQTDRQTLWKVLLYMFKSDKRSRGSVTAVEVSGWDQKTLGCVIDPTVYSSPNISFNFFQGVNQQRQTKRWWPDIKLSSVVWWKILTTPRSSGRILLSKRFTSGRKEVRPSFS